MRIFLSRVRDQIVISPLPPNTEHASDQQGEDMKRKIIGFVVALVAVAGFGLVAPAPASADLGGQCDAHVDVNCRYYTPWGWQTCEVHTSVIGCTVDVDTRR